MNCNTCNKTKKLNRVTYFNPHCIYSNPFKMLCNKCKNENKSIKLN